MAWEDLVDASDEDAERVGSNGDPLTEVQGDGEEVAEKERALVGEEESDGEKEGSAGVPLASLDLEDRPLNVALGEN